MTPHFFRFIYQLGMKLSNKRHKSPVDYANALMAKYLSEYLKKQSVDILVMLHLYPAETITYMKKKKMLR
jgi:processive 1,2-diacylglycerol beta-glucosyltransferase